MRGEEGTGGRVSNSGREGEEEGIREEEVDWKNRGRGRDRKE